jgi:hypothetical protein
MRWWWILRRSSTTEGDRRDDTTDDARAAIRRARRSQVEAVGALTEMRILNGELRHEIGINHLAQDIHDVMRRKR